MNEVNRCECFIHLYIIMLFYILIMLFTISHYLGEFSHRVKSTMGEFSHSDYLTLALLWDYFPIEYIYIKIRRKVWIKYKVFTKSQI